MVAGLAGATDRPALHFALSGSAPAAEATVPPPEDLNTRARALSTLVSAGADLSSAAELVGLGGLNPAPERSVK